MTRPSHQILVCTNERPADNPKGSCTARGAQPLVAALKRRVRERDLTGRVAVNTTSCLKCCPFGPVVAVWPEGEYYGPVPVERVDDLLDSLESGQPLSDLRVPEDEIGRY